MYQRLSLQIPHTFSGFDLINMQMKRNAFKWQHNDDNKTAATATNRINNGNNNKKSVLLVNCWAQKFTTSAAAAAVAAHWHTTHRAKSAERCKWMNWMNGTKRTRTPYQKQCDKKRTCTREKWSCTKGKETEIKCPKNFQSMKKDERNVYRIHVVVVKHIAYEMHATAGIFLG